MGIIVSIDQSMQSSTGGRSRGHHRQTYLGEAEETQEEVDDAEGDEEIRASLPEPVLGEPVHDGRDKALYHAELPKHKTEKDNFAHHKVK